MEPSLEGEPATGTGSLLVSSFSSLPGLKYGTFFGGTSTLSPVFGLRPFRGSRRRSLKLPNPRSSIFSPRWSASMMLLNTVSTMTSECFFVRSETRETSSTSSAFVMLPAPLPMVTALLLRRPQGPGVRAQRLRPSPALSPEPRFLGPLSVPKVIAERRRAGAFALLIRVPVGAELLALERADAQPDLPFLGAQLDDLHLVVLAHPEIDLLAAARRLGVVELRDVNQPLDPLVELDEGAEVRHPRDLALDGAPHLVP